MSDTPRTDKEERFAEWLEERFLCVPSEFARQLERSNAELLAACEAHISRLYGALLELVECKDLIDVLDADLAKPEVERVFNQVQREQQKADYRRRKPLAWEAARKALIECAPEPK